MHALQSPIECSVNNVFIHVTNLKESVLWYKNLLGITVDPNEVISSPVYNIPVKGSTGLTLDDHTFDPTFTFSPSSAVLFNFYVKDIDQAYTFIKQNNIEITREIERIENFAYFNFKDPDGNVLMICNN